MEGSSDSGWEKSDSSRGLNACVVSGDSRGLHSRNRLTVSGNASNNARSIQGGKERKVGSSGVSLMEQGDLSLRQWLDKPERSVDHLECLHIFRQIVETINLAHSQGIVINNVRPSCFVMSSFNRVSFIESGSCSSSGSDAFEDALNRKPLGGHENSAPEVSRPVASQRASDTSCLRSSLAFPMCKSSIEEIEERNIDASKKIEEREEMKNNFPLKQILAMEIGWYTTPEEVDGSPSSFASDIYRLGVLLFELFCTFSSKEEKLRIMSNLRHRVLPPQLLLKWPKEASFCLWLLHPQPSTRPKMCEVLQSEFLIEPRDSIEEREAAMRLKEDVEEQELLQEFFVLMQQKKQEAADKLQDTISLLSSDLDEVLKQQLIVNKKEGLYSEINKDSHAASEKIEHVSVNPVRNDDSAGMGSRKRLRPGLWIHEEEVNEHPAKVQKSETDTEKQESILSKSSRLMTNFKKLESAYFSTRLRAIKPKTKPRNRYSGMNSEGKESIVMTEGSSVDNFSSKEGQSEGRRSGWIEPFLEGLRKYLSFSKLKVRADLKQGDLLNSSNLVCSLNFDRDKEFFATAGVNKKIKVFECDSILSEDRDIHYPVVEMASRSKISSLCWNSYIKSQIASSDFEGVVQVWDVTRSQVLMEMREHERRVWSVDFSLADPTKLASGSDDGAVKLWNINQVGSIGTIKTKANVCCVQFPPDSSRSLVIGSADQKIYCYDLRSTRIPLCTLVGHSKTVSYVKFVDSMTLVSASTDNSLKLWDLATCTSRVLDSPLQTFTGHTNVKNFVGLSISDGYIATGSETNEVFIYHKAFPMPVLSYKFSSMDPVFGYEVDDASQFISAVCWRGQSSTLVAANSTGNIKLLEMV
ncbi:Protein kinase domain [Macleaya cordata]|uniref:Protein kinase domain n=1 Tax=Macleaya cordata TaxID=56857 RepID=A0A200QBK4_MACCD|nr:Protein kinase domain [Macleaya cordata]